MHLLSNMLGLYFFGREVGRFFGGRALLGLYLAGGLIGGLAHVAWKWSQIRGAMRLSKYSHLTIPAACEGRVGRGRPV